MKPSSRIKEILVYKYGGSVLELAFAIMDFLDECWEAEQKKVERLQQEIADDIGVNLK